MYYFDPILPHEIEALENLGVTVVETKHCWMISWKPNADKHDFIGYGKLTRYM